MSGRNAPIAWQADDSHAEIEPSAVLSRGMLRGAFLIIFTLGFFSMMIVPSLLVASARDNPVAAGFQRCGRALSGARTSRPSRSCSFSARRVKRPFTSAHRRLISSSPAPFHRRDLLMFKLSKMLFGLVFMALIFSISFLLYLNTWISAFVGCFPGSRFCAIAGACECFPRADRRGAGVYAQAADGPAGDRRAGAGWRCADVVADSGIKPSRASEELSCFMDGHGGAGSIRGLQPCDSGTPVVSGSGLLVSGGTGDRPGTAGFDLQAGR